KLIKPAVATTDSHGFYRLNALPPGNYSVTVEGSGMKAKATNLVLSAGDLPNLNLKMAVGAETIVDITDSVAMVDVTQSKVETTISQEILQQIPKGRTFQSAISFAPGARQEPLQSVASSATSAYANNAPVLNGGRTNGYQIDGASDAENIYLLDGLNITSVYSGGAGSGVGALGGFNVPYEFVQDVQVKSSSFEAQYGGALGGVINVISQTGGSNWHGRLFTYYRSSALNANDQCAFTYTTQCGLRLDPSISADSTNRIESPAQYYKAQQDHYRVMEPGFQLGGPLLKDKVNLYASFVPQYYSQRRTVNFTKTNPGPRSFYTTQNTYYGFSKLSYSPFSKLRLFAEWEYSMARAIGTNLPAPDSLTGQVNANASSDPNSFRSDTGTVNPASLYLFGADYTINSRTLLSVRYGYTYANAGDRGKPTGLRYLYSGAASASTKALDGTTGVPSAYIQTSGYNNITSNQQQLFNVYQRKGLTADLSYLKTGWAGTHTFQGGFAMSSIDNRLLVGYNTAEVDLYYGQAYTVGTGAGACAGIIAQNQATYKTTSTDCRGNWGYFIVHDGVDSTGEGKSNNYALYFQDSWSLGRTGLSVNAGVRFDKEFLPPYSAGAPSVSFGFDQKVAPRLGVAYDVLHNGKLKLYASYGQFYDIMKYSLPQGSFGGQYWHDCAYAMDDPNYNLV
ncbi:MAG: TonB-dependent receptor, partial [Acidobacteriales bacterium]|nr:TonB-dependent receptor [Terriglobales bacterium]